jgi:hypothetical protein
MYGQHPDRSSMNDYIMHLLLLIGQPDEYEEIKSRLESCRYERSKVIYELRLLLSRVDDRGYYSNDAGNI